MGEFIDHPDIPEFEYNYITDGIYVGTNQCCQTHFDNLLKEEGIEADVSIEGEKVDQPFGVLFYVWVPVNDHTAPMQEQMDFAVASLEKLVAMGKKVYLHCKNGHGRAPTMFSAYLIKTKGMSPDEAIAFIHERRTTIHLDDEQVEALREFEKRCNH